MRDRVRRIVDEQFQPFREELESLVRIPSISAPGFSADAVRASAEATRKLLDNAGFQRARLLEIPGTHPYVAAERLDCPGKPTVLLYAHHDVQPQGRADRWTSEPFTPVERDGRLYGRGASDDKAGAVLHAAAVSAWLEASGKLPCNVKVLVEGEEEIGSPHLHEFLERFGGDLRADVMVLADAGNWSVGRPALTFSLRGLTEVTVRVRALKAPQHSGMFGGLIPDPAIGLSRMLGTLMDDQGRVAIAGIYDDVRPPTPTERARLGALPFDAATYRENAGLLDGVELFETDQGGPWERIWMQPAITVIGFDAHPILGSSNQIVAEASARVSLRLAPGQDPQRCQNLLVQHLRKAAPWRLQVDITPGKDSSPAWLCEPVGPAFEAAEAALTAGFGVAPHYMGVGGSIPFVDAFARAFPGTPALLTGPSDPGSRIHSEDESLHLGDWRSHMHAEAILLDELARRLTQ